jgi:hypothetical protein
MTHLLELQLKEATGDCGRNIIVVANHSRLVGEEISSTTWDQRCLSDRVGRDLACSWSAGNIRELVAALSCHQQLCCLPDRPLPPSGLAGPGFKVIQLYYHRTSN